MNISEAVGVSVRYQDFTLLPILIWVAPPVVFRLIALRISMRRFTRLTNGFSKKVENLEHAVSLHFMYYNFARPHKTLANPYPRTPAMAAGVSDHIWTIQEIVRLTNLD